MWGAKKYHHSSSAFPGSPIAEPGRIKCFEWLLCFFLRKIKVRVPGSEPGVKQLPKPHSAVGGSWGRSPFLAAR